MAMQNHSSLFLLNISIPLSLKKGEKVVCVVLHDLSKHFHPDFMEHMNFNSNCLSGSTLRLSLAEL